MRFVSSWSCGVFSAWAYVAWLDGGTTTMYIALSLVLITFGQAMWSEAQTQRVTNRAVKELYKSLQDKNSEAYKEFMAGLDQGVKDAAGSKE